MCLVLSSHAGQLGGLNLTERRSHRALGQRRRASFYLGLATLGSDSFRLAGTGETAVTWARVHHEPDQWRTAGVAYPIGAVLALADGERLPRD